MSKPTKGYYVIPRDKLEAVNKALAAEGLGDDFFSVPLIQGEGKLATHYAASCSLHPWQQAKFDAVIASEKPKEIKQQVEARLSKAGFASLLSAQTVTDKKPWKVQAVSDKLAEMESKK
jgi:hypothetical protein